MAGLSGTSGAVTVGDGPSIGIFQWDGDLQREVFDDSKFGSESTAKTKIGGMAVLQGTCQGWATVGTTPGVGTLATAHRSAGGTFNLVIDTDGVATDKGYTFTGIMENMTVDVVKTGLVRVSFTFKSTGVVALIS